MSSDGDIIIKTGEVLEGVVVERARLVVHAGATLRRVTLIDPSHHRTDLPATERNGIMVMGDGVTLDGCEVRNPAYAGINLRASCRVIGCRVTGGVKGLSANHNGKAIESVIIDDFAASGGACGLQLDTRLHQIRYASLRDLRLSGAQMAAKVATCDRLLINGLHAPDIGGKYGLVFGEGLMDVTVRDAHVAEGLTHFPEKDRPQASVKRLAIYNSTIGPSPRVRAWDHMQVESLVMEDVTLAKWPEPGRYGEINVKHLGAYRLRNVRIEGPNHMGAARLMEDARRQWDS